MAGTKSHSGGPRRSAGRFRVRLFLSEEAGLELADIVWHKRENEPGIQAEDIVSQWIHQYWREEVMEDPTILEQTREIRTRYQRGDITPAEAKQLIKPYYEQYVKLAKAKAQKAGMKAPVMSLQKFLSRRSDLRYAAQQQAIEQRQAPESSEE